MLKRQPDGTFLLDLRWVKVSDLSILEGLPISILNIGNGTPTDLAPLRSVPLVSLSLEPPLPHAHRTSMEPDRRSLARCTPAGPPTTPPGPASR